MASTYFYTPCKNERYKNCVNYRLNYLTNNLCATCLYNINNLPNRNVLNNQIYKDNFVKKTKGDR